MDKERRRREDIWINVLEIYFRELGKMKKKREKDLRRCFRREEMHYTFWLSEINYLESQ